MKLGDLERHLLAHGARKVGEGAKHTKWRSAEGARATAIPRHTEIDPGIVGAICRQLEIPALVAAVHSERTIPDYAADSILVLAEDISASWGWPLAFE